MANTLVLQELRRLILAKTGIRMVSPSDCRIISMAIQKELKKNVSETTIKRLFGFAEIKHEFSKFTMNTLKEYVDMVNDPHQLDFLLDTQGSGLAVQRSLAERITYATLQNIRNRSSVPYELTIPRAFANQEITSFFHSSHSYTAFISQPGYGKSILLSHLVQELFLNEHAPLRRQIILFFNADQIFSKQQTTISLDASIKEKLNLPETTDLFFFSEEQWIKYGVKLLVVIDGFSELIINSNTNPKILDSLIDFVSNIGELEGVKLILGLRTTSWIHLNERIRHAHFFKRKWYPGTYFNSKDNSNIPPLTELEVKKIFEKMSPLEFDKISENLKSQLKFPFHIQWYYQLKEEYPAFESYTNIVFYEIIERLIEEKIYKSTYSTEKVLFCKTMIQLTNYGRRGYTVGKIDLMKEMPIYQNAYEDLLVDGILMEEKALKNGVSTDEVRFVQPHVFEYFLFIELYDLFNMQMDKKYFELVNSEYNGNQVRFQLLQWSVRLLIKLCRYDDIKAFLDLKLNSDEKNYLIYFIEECLRYNAEQNPDSNTEIEVQQLHSLLMQNLET